MPSDQYSVLGKAPGPDDLKKLLSSDVHLTIKQLSAGYGKMEILYNFDLFVSKAQSLCLIGPNGAGKSTILHSIYGFTNIFSGQIEIDGKEITFSSSEEKQIDAEVIRLQTEYDAQAYARNRKAEYDALNQLEMQYDDEEDGTTTWKDAIAAIKKKYPKG